MSGSAEYEREWNRRNRTVREDGLLVRKNSPEQWQLAEYMLSHGFSVAATARITRMSYQMTYKIATGNFSHGIMPNQDEE